MAREYDPEKFKDFLIELRDLLNKYGYTILPFQINIFIDEGVYLAGFTPKPNHIIEPVYFIPDDERNLIQYKKKGDQDE